MTKTVDINVLALHIRMQLHSGICPGQGAKGELAYIMPAANTSGWDAWIYAWSDDLKASEIAAWFTDFGCTGVLVFHQMHDEDNEIVEGRSTLDNVRPFLVTFHAKTDETPAPHPDDLAVDGFTQLMKAKMELKRHQGRGGWDDKLQCSQALLTQLLREHVEKGDPVDVANFCMMLSARGEKILPSIESEYQRGYNRRDAEVQGALL